jgi:hypothetical protein
MSVMEIIFNTIIENMKQELINQSEIQKKAQVENETVNRQLNEITEEKKIIIEMLMGHYETHFSDLRVELNLDFEESMKKIDDECQSQMKCQNETFPSECHFAHPFFPASWTSSVDISYTSLSILSSEIETLIENKEKDTGVEKSKMITKPRLVKKVKIIGGRETFVRQADKSA